MSTLTLGQASKLVGKSKPTISKAIADGKLSGQKVNGVYEIEKSELLRVYEEKPKQSEKAKTTSNTSGGSAVAALERKHLEEKLVETEARLSRLHQRFAQTEDKLEAAEVREREANARVFALIEDKRPKSLWQKVLGK
jgi:serine/threonine protein kinase HipA of HipAB toxin-antitoxin module